MEQKIMNRGIIEEVELDEAKQKPYVSRITAKTIAQCFWRNC